jgi:YihY family inner membrane protein
VSQAEEILGVVRAVIEAVRSDQLSMLAASLAYYMFVSVLPLLLLVFIVATALVGEALATDLLAQLGAVLSPTGEDLLVNTLTNAQGRDSVTVIGILVLLWGSLRLFRGLDQAFAHVYGTTSDGSFVERFVDAAVALAAVGTGVLVAVTISVLIGALSLPSAELLGTPALAVALTITFLPLYLLLPDVEVSVGEALPGAVFAAGGWTILGTAFRVYADLASSFRLYGVIGGILLLVTWFYLGGLVVLVGAVLNAVLADRYAPTI